MELLGIVRELGNGDEQRRVHVEGLEHEGWRGACIGKSRGHAVSEWPHGQSRAGSSCTAALRWRIASLSRSMRSVPAASFATALASKQLISQPSSGDLPYMVSARLEWVYAVRR